MIDLDASLTALAAVLSVSLFAWLVSIIRRDVSIVDSLWSLLMLTSALSYSLIASTHSSRSWLVLGLLTIWALRLSAHITLRNWGEPEDYRYQQMRSNNSPHFWLKSIYIVFGLQALLAWFISLPVHGATSGPHPLGWLDAAGATLWAIGFVFEALGDFQLARFRGNPANAGRVLASGLWRYTRHPNYFGDFCVWWGLYLIAAAGGAWWTILSPLLMSFLLLKVSGVAMLEKTIANRRPDYQIYTEDTNAFFPGPPRKPSSPANGA